MPSRGSPKLDLARVAVGAVLARAGATGWSLRRLRAEMRVARTQIGVSAATFYRAILLVAGVGARRLRDPKRVHAVLARLGVTKARAA